jgi:hypothetical protein
VTNNDYSACIQACLDCAMACERCATGCLLEKDVTMMAKCILHDRDCADVCRLAAVLMARDATHAPQFCKLCAEFCDACAAECAKHEHEHCKACAAACKSCAEACRKMAGTYGK